MSNIEMKYSFVTLKRNDLADLNTFIDNWSKSFMYLNMASYTDLIYREEFSVENIEELFTWKNGMKLSGKKDTALKEKILSKHEIINQLKRNWNTNIFDKTFSDLSAIWKIFLMHIIQPNEYPIFDQHVFRAFKYISEQDKDASLPTSNGEKIKIYHKDYKPFYLNCKDIMNDNFTAKQLDSALWTFGKFLSEYPNLIS
jgi:hypothetical protein